jgi:hypothetical protein
MKRLVGILVAVTLISGCAIRGKIKETQPMTATLGTYSSVRIVVTGNDKELESMAPAIKRVIEKRLESEGVFDSVADQGAELEIAILLKKHVKGDRLKREMHLGGEAEFEASGTVTDVKRKTTLSAFDLTGNSAYASEVSIGGLEITSLQKLTDDLDHRASVAMADHILDYVKDHK